MKKILIILLGLLALTSCSNGDEPMPDPYNGGYGSYDLYVATTGFPWHPEMICSIHGDTIYECAEGAHVLSLLAEDSDWYALLKTDDGVYSSVKNGMLFRVYNVKTIWGFTVDGGAIYTVQENYDGTVWVCKDDQRLYDVPNYVQYNQFSVHDGNVSMGINDGRSGYWYNGSYIEIYGLQGGCDWVYGIDKQDDNLLITYQSNQESGEYFYYWNGKNYELPENFIPTTSQLVNGHAFVLGGEITSIGASAIRKSTAVIIDGIETVLNEQPDLAAVQLVASGAFTFILVRDIGGRSNKSCIYQNLKLMEVPKSITVPEDVRKYYAQYMNEDGKMSLADLGITAIARVKTVSY